MVLFVAIPAQASRDVAGLAGEGRTELGLGDLERDFGDEESSAAR